MIETRRCATRAARELREECGLQIDPHARRYGAYNIALFEALKARCAAQGVLPQRVYLVE